MALSNSSSGPHYFRPPEVQIDWCGFRAGGWELQRAGWKFEEMEWRGDDRDPFGRRRTITMRHPSGMCGLAECEDRELYGAVERSMNRYGEAPLLFTVTRISDKSDRIAMHVSEGLVPRARFIDFEPNIIDGKQLKMRRLTLADLYREQPAEEIIVEPATVMGLLEQIKQLQAPDLARIREQNRRREASERVPEIRHATILSLAA
jgi:hypothetical protein